MDTSPHNANEKAPGNFLPKGAAAARVRCVRDRGKPLQARVRLDSSKSISSSAVSHDVCANQ